MRNSESTVLGRVELGNTYSSELKAQAVQDYLAGKGSLRDICSNYHISATYVLRDWIKR